MQVSQGLGLSQGPVKDCTHVLSAHSQMYQVQCAYRAQEEKAAIIRLDRIQSGCHLIPKFGLEMDNSWTATNVLEKCNSFFVNTFLLPYFFQVLSMPASLEVITETGPEMDGD